MGAGVEREHFQQADYDRFGERLERSLWALRQLLARPGFGVGPATVGAELELFLVDAAGRPLPRNDAVRADSRDARVTVEVDRFDLEVNLTPAPMAGRPFAAFGRELDQALTAIARVAAAHGGRVATIGILPTLRPDDLGRAALSDRGRYRAIDRGLRRLRHQPFRIRIDGQDPLDTFCDGISLEGANSSWQLHLRVDPAAFGRTYDAVQLATPPVLAAAGNSPTFLGHRLWDETRIVLFKQSVDTRDEEAHGLRVARVGFGTGWARDGALEQFEQSVRLHQPVLPLVADEDPLDQVRDGRVPHLAELRLHQGTVWRWNRAIYDPAGGGHLRIELRSLPSGPTVTDMLANAAFALGLSLALAPEAAAWTRALPFERVHHDFYRAAQQGLDAKIAWPLEPGRPRTYRAAELVPRLLPLAYEGLVDAGVAPGEAAELLEVVAARVASGRTGAVWQRRVLDRLVPVLGRKRALAVMLDRYVELSAAGAPVHTWPVEG
ncbi:MAG TPA: glutamate--cysteine ligase [Actinomycetes bacterium]